MWSGLLERTIGAGHWSEPWELARRAQIAAKP